MNFHLNYMWYSFSLLWINLANLSLTRTDHISNPVIVHPGVYLQRLPNVTFYQATRKLLFRFQLPHSLFANKGCIDYICKINTKLCRMMLSIPTYFKNIEPYIDVRHTSDDDSLLVDDGELYDFQYATRSHVKRLFATTHEINFLQGRINQMRAISIIELKYINQFNLFSYCNCTDNIAIDAIIGEILSLYEYTRSLAEMCQNRKLKIDVVSMLTLQESLKEIRKQTSLQNFTLSLDSISSYYMLPLTECVMSDDTVLIGLHIPVLRSSLHGLSMRKIVTAPFSWESHTCSVAIPNIDVAIVHTMHGWTLLTPKCDPFHEELCLLNHPYENDALAISCVEHLLTAGTATQLSKACPLQCRETGATTEFFTRLETNKYMVTHPQPYSKVQCNNTEYQMPATTIGALEIHLRCNCKILGNRTTIEATDESCFLLAQPVVMQHVIPAEWLKYTGLKLPIPGQPNLNFDKLEDCLNDKWLQSTSTSMPVISDIQVYIWPVIIVFVLSHIVFSILLCRRIKKLSQQVFIASTLRTNRISFTRPLPTQQTVPLSTLPNTSSPPTIPERSAVDDTYLSPDIPPAAHELPRRRKVQKHGTIEHSKRVCLPLPSIPEEITYLPMTKSSADYVQMEPPRTSSS